MSRDTYLSARERKTGIARRTPDELTTGSSIMPHGYHREFQLLKDILFPSLELMHKCLLMADYMLQHIMINANILEAPIYEYLFTVEEVNEGKFRYQGADGKTNGQLTPADLKHSSMGSLGNLCTEQIKAKMDGAARFQSY